MAEDGHVWPRKAAAEAGRPSGERPAAAGGNMIHSLYVKKRRVRAPASLC